MTRLFSGPSSALNLLNASILVGGAVVALELGNAQTFQRSGTLIVAVTGLFVVTQVLDEIRMERLLAESAAHSAQHDSQLTTMARLAHRIRRNDDEQRASKVRQARLTLVVLIALWLSLGEVVSGFGDLAFKAVRSGDPPLAAAAPNLRAPVRRWSRPPRPSTPLPGAPRHG